MTKRPKGRAVGLGVAALFVAVGVALLGTAGLVFGQTTVQIEGHQIVVGGTEVTRLEAFDVDVGSPLCVLVVDVTYDPLVKTPTSCDPDPSELFDQSADCTIGLVAPNTIRFGGVDSVDGLTGDIPLADITWSAVGSAGASTNLGVTVVTFADCAGAAIPVTPVPGTNTIVSPTPTPTPSPTATSTATSTSTVTVTVTTTATKTVTKTATATPVVTGTATPVVTETATPLPPTETATPPTVTVTTTPPTTAVPATGTPKVTPIAPPPTGGGGLGPLSGLPWPLAAGAGAILVWMLAAAGVLHTVRRRSG